MSSQKQEKTLVMTVLMTPDKANFSGVNVHGGELLKILDWLNRFLIKNIISVLTKILNL